MSGKIYAIGLGPGHLEGMTLEARERLVQCEAVVGYKVYVEQIRPWLQDKKIYQNGMGQEIQRCEQAIRWALEGKEVAMVCSGDAGLYGMAGLLYELIEQKKVEEQVKIQVMPGVTSALSCAALLGAPIVEDFCTISLSDYMTPYEKIEKRLAYASKADFTIALYNPRSRKRPDYLEKAIQIILQERQGHTPVGIVRQAYREEQAIIRTTLEAVPYETVDMFCTVMIGNSRTRWLGEAMVTSRGYAL